MSNTITSSLFDSLEVSDALTSLSKASDKDRGAVFTRHEVVNFILDLTNYTNDNDLTKYRLLEPSFGDGDFLLIAIKRLLDLYKKKKRQDICRDLKDNIRGVELHTETFERTKDKVIQLIKNEGYSNEEAETLTNNWLVNDDYLLTPISLQFTHVVGNPPYVRQESIPAPLIKEYRKRFKTIYDRADLYIPFIEKSLLLLDSKGTLGFICADRWMKNKYGGPLRRLIYDEFHLKYHIDMVGLPAFNKEVSAYAAITIITKEKSLVTRVAQKPIINHDSLKKLASELLNNEYSSPDIKELSNVANGSSPWLLNGSLELDLTYKLEENFKTLEQEGCKVGIGVATGCDKVYIGNFNDLPVEKDRKIPLVMTKDINSGKVEWKGKGIINPFTETGKLVNLDEYPLLKKYFNLNKEKMQSRNVAKRNPNSWYRTIDRIYPDLTLKPKLLIPDIKLIPNVVYEEGYYYPHHNLYYVISDKWDLKALQAVLKSSITRFFITVYSVKMRGNYLRFQAQYLRRIRIPEWESLPKKQRNELIKVANESDISKIDKVVFNVYGLSKIEQSIVKDAVNGVLIAN